MLLPRIPRRTPAVNLPQKPLALSPALVSQASSLRALSAHLVSQASSLRALSAHLVSQASSLRALVPDRLAICRKSALHCRRETLSSWVAYERA
jgi:hypothetical protein